MKNSEKYLFCNACLVLSDVSSSFKSWLTVCIRNCICFCTNVSSLYTWINSIWRHSIHYLVERLLQLFSLLLKWYQTSISTRNTFLCHFWKFWGKRFIIYRRLESYLISITCILIVMSVEVSNIQLYITSTKETYFNYTLMCYQRSNTFFK